MKKYTCPKCGTYRIASDLVVGIDVGCGCRVGGYSVEYIDRAEVKKYPDQVLRNKDTSMKLPKKYQKQSVLEEQVTRALITLILTQKL